MGLVFWVRRGLTATADDGFDALLKLGAGQQDAMPAAQAADTNIRAQPHHFPLARPAGVRLAETDNIAEVKLRNHSSRL